MTVVRVSMHASCRSSMRRGGLHRPNAAKRKLQGGNGAKTYFRAEVRQDGSEDVLELVEDL
jgi:hypothetical protein